MKFLILRCFGAVIELIFNDLELKITNDELKITNDELKNYELQKKHEIDFSPNGLNFHNRMSLTCGVKTTMSLPERQYLFILPFRQIAVICLPTGR